MKHKVSELEGDTLDLAVAYAGGLAVEHANLGAGWMVIAADGLRFIGGGIPDRRYSPSTDWLLGGAIIERERIGVHANEAYPPSRAGGQAWTAYRFGSAKGEGEQHGPTPLIAAMRAYCSAKFGDEVELP